MSNFEQLLHLIGQHELVRGLEHISMPRKLRLSVLLSRAEQHSAMGPNNTYFNMSNGPGLTFEEAAVATCEGLEWRLGDYSE